MKQNRSLSLLAVGALTFAAACTDPAAPSTALSEAQGPTLASTYGSTLLECPTDVERVAEANLLPLIGGTVEVDGHSISIPGDAIIEPVSITLKVPASNYLEIDIKANGAEHYVFQKAVTVKMSYQRCTRSNINKYNLTAWYIDSNTKALLENMNGTDSKTNKTVTFNTGHLSGYAIAY